MPNRILKETICTSANVDALGWFEEVCFYRLIVQCDDYGRMDGRPLLLRARLFPLKEDITAEAVQAAMEELERVGLVERYTVMDKPYLQLCTWNRHQRVRTKRRRFPPPPWELGVDEWEEDE